MKRISWYLPSIVRQSYENGSENGSTSRGRLDIPLLLPHLLESIRQVKRANLLGVLELEELVPAMACHVHQYVAAVVGQQPLATGRLVADAVGQQADEVLNRHLVAAVVDLDVVAIEVDGAVGVGVDGAREGVARVAGHIVGQHQDDLGVRDAQTLDGAVDGQHVGQVAVVEPEAGGAHQHRPVAGVLGKGDVDMTDEDEEDEEEGGDQRGDGQLGEGRETHRGLCPCWMDRWCCLPR